MLDRQVAGQLDRLQEMIEKLCNQPAPSPQHDLPETLFRVFTDMIEAEVDEAIARDLVDRIRSDSGVHVADSLLVKARIAQIAGGRDHGHRADHHFGRQVPAGGAGRSDRRRQDDDDRQAGGQLSAAGEEARRPDHGRHLPRGRGRATADVCRHHRPADGSRRRRRARCARRSPGCGISTSC